MFFFFFLEKYKISFIKVFPHSKKCWVVTQIWVKYGLTQMLG